MDQAAQPNLTASSLDLAGLSGDRLRAASDGWHVVLPLGGGTHRLWLPTRPGKRVTYSVKLPLDEHFEARARAAQRLWRALNGRPLGPTLDGLAPRQRGRLAMALRALDGHLEGASYRTIAGVLFGPARIPSRAWKTDDLRSRTIRLVQLGLRLMRGGYRELLRPRHRKRRR
ncbi:DUF2285 domain-containing protein [Bradyrhizobium sp. SZCCHNRI20481]|uniref:DUF2285 domain-containing protein n=1 Tax=Bradyrhizobium sp. SZCCHNRI20481 TaxID=3057286 RepID=UPI002915FC44|nr:DUF2285 domain-containing protein [Bradyrhizobium sp. SZCCHNRI20481]